MAKNIRSEFVKKLMDDKSNLESVLAESAGNAIKDILGSSIKSGIRNILKEADEKEFSEEEVEKTTPEIEPETDDKKEEDGKETETDKEEIEIVDDNGDELDAADKEEDTVEGNDGEEAEKDIWSDLEEYKNEDGEYDLTGLGKDVVIDIIKCMEPDDDEVRIVKNEDGTFELTDEDNTAVFSETDLEDEGDKDEDGKTEFEIELSDEGDNLYEEENLGYDAHQGQDKTAVTMPDDKDDAKGDIKMDAGLPKGSENNKQNWAGDAKKNSDPYNENGEELVFEIEMEDEDDTTFSSEEEVETTDESMTGGARVNKMSAKGNDSEAWRVRNPRNHVGRTNESRFNNRMNEILDENKKLRKVADEIRNSLQENIVINKSLAKVIKLMVENTTSHDEKVDIVKRFNNVRTLNECNELYEKISGELKKASNITESANVANPISEQRKTQEHTAASRLDESKDVTSMRSLIDRIEKL